MLDASGRGLFEDLGVDVDVEGALEHRVHVAAGTTLAADDGAEILFRVRAAGIRAVGVDDLEGVDEVRLLGRDKCLLTRVDRGRY